MSTSLPQSGGTTASFSNAPQANGDSFAYLEDYLLANSQLYNQTTETLTLDVMANDLGGKAKSLFSIDDGDGNPITDLSQTDLLTNLKYSDWQLTANRNYMRIYNGKIEYRLSDGQGGYRDVDSLNAGEVLPDSFTYAIKLGNGTLSWARVTITLTGNNDAPTATATSAAVAEDASTSGVLSGSDVDHNAALIFTIDSAPTGFSLTNAATGAWSFDAASYDSLAAGEALVVAVAYTVTDEHGLTSYETLTITVTGTNDPAVISGNTSGSANEAGGVNNGTGGSNAIGDLNSTDVDNTNDAWNAVVSPIATVSGYGSYTIDASGNWTFVVSNGNAAVQALNVGGSLSDSFVVTTVDGTQQTVNVTINGANDAAVINGATTGSVTEAGGTNNSIPGTPTASGTLTDSDVDNPLNTFTAVAAGAATSNGYGTYAMTEGGTWTYTLNNANATVNALNTGQTLTDSFAVTSVDGTSQLVTVTINGTTDVVVPAPNDLIFTVLAGGINGNGAPNGDFGQLSVGNAAAGASYVYSVTSLTATTLAGVAAANSAGDLTVSISGVVTGTSVDADRVYELTTQVTNGANTYSETFSIVVGTNSGTDNIDGTYTTGDDVIFAVGGADIVLAGSGNDSVFGQAGADQIHGGLGNDTLYGAAGNDQFFFNTVLNTATNVDRLMDFNASTNASTADQIILDDTIFAALGSGGQRSLAAGSFVANSGGNAADANDYFLFDTVSGSLYYDADGSGAGVKVLFAQIDLGGFTGTLDATDFIII